MSVLQMRDCIDALEEAFSELSNGSAVMPLRIGIPAPDGVSLYMPAYLKQMNALAVKVVSVYKNNPQKHQLPTTIGKVLVQNPETGEVICIMDGGYLTAVRTGAVSGLATRFLARPDENQVVAIFGAGVQAQMQLWGVCEARKISRALVYDVVPGAAQKFAQSMGQKLNLEIVVAEEPQALLEADIICTATSSATPIFDGARVRPGTHINGIGSHSPGTRELDSTIIQRSLLVADARDACLNEAGDVMIPIKEGVITADHIYADLGEIVTRKKPARTSDSQITLFKSNGLAIQDVAASRLVYEKALAAGLGVEVDL
jgi:ornithine cyclodeaminase/alanine dehydrogenase